MHFLSNINKSFLCLLCEAELLQGTGVKKKKSGGHQTEVLLSRKPQTSQGRLPIGEKIQAEPQRNGNVSIL